MSFQIFIIEDDPWFAEVVMHHLGLNPEFDLVHFPTGTDAINNLYRNPDAICMDYGLPDMDGEKLLRQIRLMLPDVPVIVCSAQDEIAVAVRLLKQGATDYVNKTDHFHELLWKAMVQAKEHADLKKTVDVLKGELEEKYAFNNTIVGQSPAIKATFPLVQKAINSQINVTISGETGTGKEVYAKAIHYNGMRKKLPFVAVNMAAIPHELIESELFGHEKGSFTGALQQRIGKLEEANGGTLFLDEIADLPLAAQSKLLRVLQEREVTKVGGNQSLSVDFRLITATHKNLASEVAAGRFREDLYYRIMGLTIELPPLRSRQNDVLILAKHFSDEFAKSNRCQKLNYTEEAKSKLRKHLFPGNVRELKACIELACVMCENDEIQEGDISFLQVHISPLEYQANKTLKDHEIVIIDQAVRKHGGNIVAAAKQLDISKSKIYQLIKEGLLKHR
jgi:DNA-binding NtrC family response regulator